MSARLSQETLRLLRQQLERSRADLQAATLAQARELATPPGERGEDTTPSLLDVASDVSYRENLIERELVETNELTEVESALRRMASGTFGLCVDCGGAIPIERLMVRPSASRDIACARRLERPASPIRP